MTLREIIYDVLEHLNAYSDDTKFSEEHIAFIVNNKRNMLLKQYMSNLRKEVPKEAIQSICIPLEIDNSCFDDMKVLKSTIKIPSTLENTGRSNIIKAYSGNKFAKNINIIDYNRIPFVDAEKYNSKQLFIAVDTKSNLIVYNSSNNHLLLESIELDIVAENPEEAYALSCEASTNCDFYDAHYPIEAALIDALKMQVVNDLLLKYKIPQDEINDGENTIAIERNQRTKR